jgi:phosphoenolpyruvate synthase/pyruvate phosphate dikinase
VTDATASVPWFSEIGLDDVLLVGGKHASLGEMYRELSDYPEFAIFLLECRIDSISLNPNAALPTMRLVIAAERSSTVIPLSDVPATTTTLQVAT